MISNDRIRSTLGPKAAALLIIAFGIGATVLAPSAHAQATTARPAGTSFTPVAGTAAIPHQAEAATTWGHIWNSDGQCLDADSNHWGQNGDNVQLWACNSNGEQSWTLQLNTGHILNSDRQCLDADSNNWGQNGDNVQLWGCNGNGEQIWPQG